MSGQITRSCWVSLLAKMFNVAFVPQLRFYIYGLGTGQYMRICERPKKGSILVDVTQTTFVCSKPSNHKHLKPLPGVKMRVLIHDLQRSSEISTPSLAVFRSVWDPRPRYATQLSMAMFAAVWGTLCIVGLSAGNICTNLHWNLCTVPCQAVMTTRIVLKCDGFADNSTIIMLFYVSLYAFCLSTSIVR